MATTAEGEAMLQLLQEFRDFRLETQSSFQGLDARMNALEEQIRGLDRRVRTLEALFESLDRRVGMLDQRVGSLEILFGSLDQRVGSLELMVTHLHGSNQRLLGYIKRVGKMLVQIATDQDELDARLDSHERRLLFLEK